MGIVKDVVKKAIVSKAEKVGDGIAKLSVLSPEQVEVLQQKRKEYFSNLQKFDPNDLANVALTEKYLAAAGIDIFNAYLPQLTELYTPVDFSFEYPDGFNAPDNIRYYNITKWVTDKKENSLEKLINVYAVLSNEDCNIALIFHRTRTGTDVYIAVVSKKNSQSKDYANGLSNRLADAIKGNFPGAEFKEATNLNGGKLDFLSNFDYKNYSVAAATNIATEKSEKFISQTIEKLLDGNIPESDEKSYTIILLATPIDDVEERKLTLSQLASSLTPFSTWQTNYTYTNSESNSSTANGGVNLGISAGVQRGYSYGTTVADGTTQSSSSAQGTSEGSTTGETTGTNESTSNSNGEAINNQQTTGNTQTSTESSSVQNSSVKTATESTASGTISNETKSASGTIGVAEQVNVSQSTGGSASLGVGPVGGSVYSQTTVGVGVSSSQSVTTSVANTEGTTFQSTQGSSISLGTAQMTGKATSESLSSSVSEGTTISHNVAETIGKTLARSISNTATKTLTNTLGQAVSKTISTANNIANSVNLGGNFGVNFARASTVNVTVGENEGITQNFANNNIKHTIEVLEDQMKRYEQSVALGMWDFAAYVVSPDKSTANNVAHSYLALTQGEQSYMSKAAINVWDGSRTDDSNNNPAKCIMKYLENLHHPIFALETNGTSSDDIMLYPAIVTATTALSGKELAYSLNMPKSSIAGLPVLECVPFGRNVISYSNNVTEKPNDAKIKLGNIFHMNHEEAAKVSLSKNSLASHTFITGSTGTGKSNTIYRILSELHSSDVKFLVIEPAKGEYKNVFGNMDDVAVYGTNPLISDVLRINPFSFPDNIHILEHLDRLVEIFNVCWPMYAAMPAVLKSAVEKSYIDCGWDMIRSESKIGEKLYPTFNDVARNIKTIIDTSEYDAENKGAYKGSLLTRLQSLSTGLNGMIFTSNELDSKQLFDSNAIVDLSRVGSSETKSLIMGMLVMKLQEHRMSEAVGMNSELKHLTVLEEAHNILRRSSSKNSEGSDIQGKSVEMLANAIAEMRTYGEGFIIADQAPELMDMAVIRNTNTKIIMRLPDQSDRELVGKAANLDDDQIKELAKLPCGVASVYQNEWIQPVLCKVQKCRSDSSTYKCDVNIQTIQSTDDEKLKEILLDKIIRNLMIKGDGLGELTALKAQIIHSGLDSGLKYNYLKLLKKLPDKDNDAINGLLYVLLDAENAARAASDCSNIDEWTKIFIENLKMPLEQFGTEFMEMIIKRLLLKQTEVDRSYNNILLSAVEKFNYGGVSL